MRGFVKSPGNGDPMILPKVGFAEMFSGIRTRMTTETKRKIPSPLSTMLNEDVVL